MARKRRCGLAGSSAIACSTIRMASATWPSTTRRNHPIAFQRRNEIRIQVQHLQILLDGDPDPLFVEADLGVGESRHDRHRIDPQRAPQHRQRLIATPKEVIEEVWHRRRARGHCWDRAQHPPEVCLARLILVRGRAAGVIRAILPHGAREIGRSRARVQPQRPIDQVVVLLPHRRKVVPARGDRLHPRVVERCVGGREARDRARWPSRISAPPIPIPPTLPRPSNTRPRRNARYASRFALRACARRLPARARRRAPPAPRRSSRRSRPRPGRSRGNSGRRASTRPPCRRSHPRSAPPRATDRASRWTLPPTRKAELSRRPISRGSILPVGSAKAELRAITDRPSTLERRSSTISGNPCAR